MSYVLLSYFSISNYCVSNSIHSGNFKHNHLQLFLKIMNTFTGIVVLFVEKCLLLLSFSD